MSANVLAQTEEQIGPEEAVKWLEEYAFKTGRIGFSTVFQPDELPKLANMGTSSTTNLICQVPTAHFVLEANEVELERYMKVYKYLQQHNDVLKGAETLMEQRLLAAGMSEEALAKRNKGGFSPRTKMIQLYNIENPRPKEPKRIRVYLLKQSERDCETQDIYISVETTLDDLKSDLDNLSATINGRGDHIPNRGKGAWMYQVVESVPSTDNRLSPPAASPRKKLLIDSDFRGLVKTLTKKGRKAKSAMLFQESTLQFQRELLTKKAEDDVWTGGLDDNGLPYFQDPDWAMLVREHFRDAAGEEKGMAQSIHSDTEREDDRAISANDNAETAETVKGKGFGLRSVTALTGYGGNAHGNATGADGQMEEPRNHGKGTNGHAESADGLSGKGKDCVKNAQCEGKKVGEETKSTQAPILDTPRRSGRIKKSPVKYA